MSRQLKHEMVLKASQPAGIEEWVCPDCGRRVLMSWPPDYKKIVMEVGDETAIHSGGKSGISMQVSKLISKEELESEEDPRLAVWSDWMNKIHFDDWWDENN